MVRITLQSRLTQLNCWQGYIHNLKLKKNRDTILRINDIINDLVFIDNELQLYDELCDDELLRKAAVRVGKSVDLINRMGELETFINTHRGLKLYSVTEVIKNVMKRYPYTTFNIEGDIQALADESLSSVLDNIINNAVTHGKTDRIDRTLEPAGEWSHAEETTEPGVTRWDDYKFLGSADIKARGQPFIA